VLGGLTEEERGEFEARLAESAGLRALVRELEEGAVAVAMASPQRAGAATGLGTDRKGGEREHQAAGDGFFVLVQLVANVGRWLRPAWSVVDLRYLGGATRVAGVAPAALASEINVQPVQRPRTPRGPKPPAQHPGREM